MAGRSADQYEVTLADGELRCHCQAFERGIGGPDGCKHVRAFLRPDDPSVELTETGRAFKTKEGL